MEGAMGIDLASLKSFVIVNKSQLEIFDCNDFTRKDQLNLRFQAPKGSKLSKDSN
jgi:hypothetical protein